MELEKIDLPKQYFQMMVQILKVQTLQGDLKLYQISIEILIKKINGIPSLRIDTPNKGTAINTAGTKPIKVLNIAVKVKAAIIH